MEKAHKRLIEAAKKDIYLVHKKEIFNYYKTTNENGMPFGGTLFSPFEIILLCSGEYYIKASPLLFDEVVTFLTTNEYSLFSDDDINKFLNSINGILNKLNWNIDSRSYNYSTVYALENLESLNISKILNTTVEITAPTDYTNISGSYNVADGSNTYFCTVLNDKIVSICGYSYIGFESVDIGTATNESYRQKGYATSNVVSMAKYILEKEKGVLYSCRHTNDISQKIALSAGFAPAANRYILYCTV